MFDIYYTKNKNGQIISSLEDITKIQNYIPLYKKFFSLTDKNYKNINLNHKYHLDTFLEKKNENLHVCYIKNENQKQKVSTFIKFSPLMDPVKYMSGKYKKNDINILPSLGNKTPCYSKIKDTNNSAYIDSFFSFLSSQTLHTHKFYHGMDFYGSFLAIKGNFQYNIVDDLEYLYQSDFFHKNKNKLFKIESMYDELMLAFNTRNYKKRLTIADEEVQSISSIHMSNELFDDVFIEKNSILDSSKNLIFEMDISHNSPKKTTKSTTKSSSTCSSRSSHTSDGGEDSETSSVDNSETSSVDNSSTGSWTTASDEVIQATIFQFPVQLICLEALDSTLDSVIGDLNTEEWRSCLFQVIMTLCVYRKLFQFTHNDLHTNNIMFKKTERKFLYYRFNNKYYKVPTYGKIYKIIDFGRSIYRFKNQLMCSDSFHKKGDAATQYNFEPYFNKNKPRLEPNASFDLCRLGCALYDFFFPDETKNIVDPIAKLVEKWCIDDKGRNILYKTNGEERYPEFKLYKMIARTVHHCSAEKEILNPLFNKFIVGRKKIKKGKVFNVDTLPSYIN